jgi:hypothetical protein
MYGPGRESGVSGGKSATNKLSYGVSQKIQTQTQNRTLFMTVCVRVCVMNDEFIINDATWKNVIVCIYIL